MPVIHPIIFPVCTKAMGVFLQNKISQHSPRRLIYILAAVGNHDPLGIVCHKFTLVKDGRAKGGRRCSLHHHFPQIAAVHERTVPNALQTRGKSNLSQGERVGKGPVPYTDHRIRKNNGHQICAAAERILRDCRNATPDQNIFHLRKVSFRPAVLRPILHARLTGDGQIPGLVQSPSPVRQRRKLRNRNCFLRRDGKSPMSGHNHQLKETFPFRGRRFQGKTRHRYGRINLKILVYLLLYRDSDFFHCGIIGYGQICKNLLQLILQSLLRNSERALRDKCAQSSPQFLLICIPASRRHQNSPHGIRHKFAVVKHAGPYSRRRNALHLHFLQGHCSRKCGISYICHCAGNGNGAQIVAAGKGMGRNGNDPILNQHMFHIREIALSPSVL